MFDAINKLLIIFNILSGWGERGAKSRGWLVLAVQDSEQSTSVAVVLIMILVSINLAKKQTTRTSSLVWPSLIELLKNHSLESGVLSYQQLEVVFHYA